MIISFADNNFPNPKSNNNRHHSFGTMFIKEIYVQNSLSLKILART